MLLLIKTATIVTVGYGDITPQNEKEKIYTTIIMFIGSLLFAYSKILNYFYFINFQYSFVY